MTQLDAIWFSTIFLAAGSTLMLAATMLSRVLDGVQVRRRQRFRERLLGELMQPGETTRSLRRIVRKAASLGVLAPLVLQTRDILRGQSYERFIERLDAAGASNLLVSQLRGASTPVRQRAAEVLSVFQSNETRAALRRVWNDPSLKVRFAALLASMQMGDSPTFEYVLTLALKAKCFPHAARTLRLMAAERPAEAADWLRRASLAPALTITLLDGLAEAAALDAGDAALVASISRDHASPDVRAAALVVLGNHGARQCKAAVLDALDDDVWFVRVQAVVAAGRLRLGEASPALAHLAEDPSWWVRLRAGEALQRLNRAAA